MSLSDWPVQLYVLTALPGAAKFFYGTTVSSATTTGSTFVGSSAVNIYPLVYENNVNGALSDQKLNETTTHELGHAIDLGSYPHNWSQEAQSQNLLADTTYGKYVQNDFFYLDYMTWPGTAPATSAADAADRRPPCNSITVGGSPVTAPFAGVYDWLNTENFCGSGAGYDSVSGLESRFVSSGVPWRNTAIVQYVKSGKKDFASLFQQGAIPANFSYTGGWAELYAQSFAYAGYAIGQTISTSLMPRMNQLLQNGYFACTLDWAYEISVGDVQPPSPVPDLPSPMSGTCSDAVQSWYPAVLGYPNF